MYQVSYTTRHATGEPDQLWAEGVYLQDHWTICETLSQAHEYFEKVDDCNDDIHCWSISKIIEGSEPHWLEDCDNE